MFALIQASMDNVDELGDNVLDVFDAEGETTSGSNSSIKHGKKASASGKGLGAPSKIIPMRIMYLINGKYQ